MFFRSNFLVLTDLLLVVALFTWGEAAMSRFPSPSNTYASNCSSVRLEALLTLMRNTSATGANGPINVYVVSPGDPQGLGNTDPCFARIQYLSNFSGPGGVAVITNTNATLWVNPLYFAQVCSMCSYLLINQALYINVFMEFICFQVTNLHIAEDSMSNE